MTDTETLTLTEFLLARIAEDEAVARDASIGHVWTWDAAGNYMHSDHQADEIGEGGGECIIDTEGSNPPGEEPGAHIARHDPARVLAECQAKRRIVERCTPYDDIQVRKQTRHLARGILCDLAATYAGHPDYRNEWRP